MSRICIFATFHDLHPNFKYFPIKINSFNILDVLRTETYFLPDSENQHRIIFLSVQCAFSWQFLSNKFAFKKSHCIQHSSKGFLLWHCTLKITGKICDLWSMNILWTCNHNATYWRLIKSCLNSTKGNIHSPESFKHFLPRLTLYEVNLVNLLIIRLYFSNNPSSWTDVSGVGCLLYTLTEFQLSAIPEGTLFFARCKRETGSQSGLWNQEREVRYITVMVLHAL